MHRPTFLRAAAGLLASIAPLSATLAAPVAAADCLSGEWQSISYRSTVEAVLGPSYAVQELSGTSHLWLRPDNTFAVVADGLHISATKGTHQVSLSFSGRESGRYRQEVPGQFVLPEIVVEASASDIVADGNHVDGPVDISNLFLWTPAVGRRQHRHGPGSSRRFGPPGRRGHARVHLHLRCRPPRLAAIPRSSGRAADYVSASR